jgi:hypothetical protein
VIITVHQRAAKLQEVGVLLCDGGGVVNVKDDMGLFCDQRVVRSKFVTEPPGPKEVKENSQTLQM